MLGIVVVGVAVWLVDWYGCIVVCAPGESVGMALWNGPRSGQRR